MRTCLHATLAAAAAIALAAPANATVMQVFDRSTLASQTVDWSAFGTPGAALSTPVSATFGSETVGIGSSAGEVELRQEGTDYTGNFAPGATLLSLPDGYRSDGFIVSFTGAPIYGVGTQIQPVSNYVGPFSAFLDLYGAGHVLLGQVTIAGTSTTANNNTAPFVGAISTTPIDAITFAIDENYPGFPREGDLAINQLSLLQTVPEPTSLFLLLTALSAFALTRRRRTVR